MARSNVIAITLGDVTGVGPELVARSLTSNEWTDNWAPLVVGHPRVLERALQLIGTRLEIQVLDDPVLPSTSRDTVVHCWNPSPVDVSDCLPAQLDARAGAAARDCLVGAIHASLARETDAIVTSPLNKKSLALAGVEVPGHTEILARECNAKHHAMMLYLAPESGICRSQSGLGVGHVTLHTSLRSVPNLLSEDRVLETIQLVHQFMHRMGCRQPRIGVAALNPHAGEDGLFGDEEQRVILPAIQSARRRLKSPVSGPIPADTLMKRAIEGEFDGVAVMYHDQGHIALKLIGFDSAVNVTLGLPIIRTSPSQGTAFDIAWKGQARPDGMLAAISTAKRLVGTPPIPTHEQQSGTPTTSLAANRRRQSREQ